MEVSSLRIYPVKSMRPVFLDSALVEKRGLQHDRRWMVIDEKNVFRTRREIPRMAQVQPRVDGDRLILSKDGMPDLCVPAFGDGPSVKVRIWRSKTTGRVVSQEADEWLTQALDMPSRLVYMAEPARRKVNPLYNAGNDIISFADGYPILVLSEESVDDLNRRLDSPITAQRFRPNIILKGAKPYEEDEWPKLRIGDVILRSAKPDIRCLVTTQDPDTGQSLGPEPLRTLATYRKTQGGVIFGMYYVPEQLGQISVGMAATPLEA